MTESIHQFVLDRLDEWKGRWATVASGSGVPKRTVEKIARQETRNPGVRHVEALANFFVREEEAIAKRVLNRAAARAARPKQ